MVREQGEPVGRVHLRENNMLDLAEAGEHLPERPQDFKI